MTLIFFCICFSTEFLFEHVRICEILCLRNWHFRIKPQVCGLVFWTDPLVCVCVHRIIVLNWLKLSHVILKSS